VGQDLADNQIVEEHPQCREVLLDRSGGELCRELLDVGGDEEGLELAERKASRLTPAEKPSDGPGVGAPGVGVADLGGEELDKSPPGALAGPVDDGGEVEDGAGDSWRVAGPADEGGGGAGFGFHGGGVYRLSFASHNVFHAT